MMGELLLAKDRVGGWRENTPLTFWATCDLLHDAPTFAGEMAEWGYREVRMDVRQGTVMFARREIAWVIRAWDWLSDRRWLAIRWLVRRGIMVCPDGAMLMRARPNCWPWRERR